MHPRREKIELLEEQDSSSWEETDITKEAGVSETSSPEHSLFSVDDSFVNDVIEIDFSDSELCSCDDKESQTFKYVYLWVEFLVQVYCYATMEKIKFFFNNLQWIDNFI